MKISMNLKISKGYKKMAETWPITVTMGLPKLVFFLKFYVRIWVHNSRILFVWLTSLKFALKKLDFYLNFIKNILEIQG